ncbi:MAG TPA: 16S rRNA (cytidine(1402)-2'-O)-methyltransferase [Polyangiaceae bacterium]|nr:16S rRNA (cytidine(1402)-2'-O)-methyltransferase [Polyangiaceae bacterium]
MPGKLYLVATPIGNLADITLRALETLKIVEVVAAEDTRRTRALLSHFEIGRKELIACNAYASESALGGLTARLLAGESIALVTDAGTPSVSDPGTELVRAAVSAQIEVVPIPGVSAVTTAVAVSGLVEGAFCFLGFPPVKGSGRRAFFERVIRSTEPSVLFEAPHRIHRTLAELSRLAPSRAAVLCRELTKLHEEVRRGTLSELAANEQTYRGEITLVVDRAEASGEAAAETDAAALEAAIVEQLEAGATPRSVVEALLESSRLPRRELYRQVTELAQRVAAASDQ